MDYLALIILALFGLVSFALATMQSRASMALSLFSWCVGIPWLFAYCVVQLLRTDPYNLVIWTGSAQMGPMTLILTTIGLSLWFCGGVHAGRTIRGN